MRQLLKNKAGSMLPLMLVIIFVLMSVSLVIGEIYLSYSLQGYIEYELQRAVNIAVESAMKDSYRQDYEGRLDADKTEETFYHYLYSYLGLNSQLEKLVNGELKYKLEISAITKTEAPPKFLIKGKLTAKSDLAFLLGKDIEIPFEIASKNVRTD